MPRSLFFLPEPHPCTARILITDFLSNEANTPSTSPGNYVYVRDVDGVVHVATDGPHMHPKVLGGANPATGAGTLTVGPNNVVTSLDNISGTFQFGPSSLPHVVGSIEAQGLTVGSKAVRPFVHFSQTP